MKTTFYSNGKLLLSGEYAVLDGALALAVPTKFGQYLEVEPTGSSELHWISLDQNGKPWFTASFGLDKFEIIASTAMEIAETLQQILLATRKSNPDFIVASAGLQATSSLTFPKNWGLGSSSTLINNIAQWGTVDAYELLSRTFGGSGYDIACAQYNAPIHYRLVEGQPKIQNVEFNPRFQDQLYFVYLNQKQDSRKAIFNYRQQRFDTAKLVEALSEITQKLTKAIILKDFEYLMGQHEEILSGVLGIQPVKAQLFPDYFGAIKSLGAWGGDFILATGNEKTPDYFKVKGFKTILPFSELLLNKK